MRLKDCIAVFISNDYTKERWRYNLWTEQWKKCPMKYDIQFPNTQHLCGVAIGSVIYTFGGGFLSNCGR